MISHVHTCLDKRSPKLMTISNDLASFLEDSCQIIHNHTSVLQDLGLGKMYQVSIQPVYPLYFAYIYLFFT